MSKDFLSFANSIMASDIATETTIVRTFWKLNKNFLLSFNRKEDLQLHFSELIPMISDQRISKIYHYTLDESIDCVVLDKESSEYSKTDMINLALCWSRDHTVTCIYFFSDSFGVFTNGRLDENYESTLEEYKTLMAKHGKILKVSQLLHAFELFKLENKYNLCEDLINTENGELIRIFDRETKKVNSNIKEQHLRNILVRFLRLNVEGETTIEHATNPYNDEESVDIKVTNGRAGAMIEVKFAFTAKYYFGPTRYNFDDRIKAGYDQLNKYCAHEAFNKQNIHYAYLYMFHTQERTDEQLQVSVDRIYESSKMMYTSEFISRFEKSIIDDVKLWKKI